MSCLRFYAAAGTGICLQADKGGVQESYRAVVLDAHLKEVSAHPLAGIPTRARVSPGGHLVAWTVFVGGDSYAGTNFSTRTSLLDLRTGKLDASLEDFAIRKDGKAYRNTDVNFWGVTFAADERTFYATLATGGQTYLVRGDLAERTVTTLRENLECPSLSPDGTRLVFKKRVPGLSADAPWRLYVLDLASMQETPLAEERSVDDQVVWTDDRTVVYSLPGDFGADLYAVPADGSGTPAPLMTWPSPRPSSADAVGKGRGGGRCRDRCAAAPDRYAECRTVTPGSASCVAACAGPRGQPQLDDRPHGRPLLVEDRVEGGTAHGTVEPPRMGPADPLAGEPEPLHRGARAPVAGVGAQRDAAHAPGLEGVAEHEQLRLGVDARPLGARGQPGIADLGGIGDRRRRIAERDARHRGPHQRSLPVVEFQEPGRTDDPAVGGSHHREGE